MTEKCVCCECVDDLILKRRIVGNEVRGHCDYCDEVRHVVTIPTLAEWVDGILRANFDAGEEYPVVDLEDDDHPVSHYKQEGEALPSVVIEVVKCSDEVSNDIADHLCATDVVDPHDGEERFFSPNVRYAYYDPDDFEYRFNWRYFCETITHKQRFLDPSLVSQLDQLFLDLPEYRTHRRNCPLREFGPSKRGTRSVYRARKARTPKERLTILADPDREMSSPPPRLARGGRMNANGIPVFYGSLDEKTALSEVRLAVGDVAVTAEFRLLRSMRVLDLTVLEECVHHLSYFDDDYRGRRARLAFLRTFDRIVSKPVSSDDQSLEYLPTQVLAEYVFERYSNQVDAIIYSSSQSGNGKKNVAIKAACAVVAVRNSEPAVRDHEDIRESWTDSRILYHRPERNTPRWAPPTIDEVLAHNDDHDQHEPFLELVPSSLRVHQCNRVRLDICSREVDLETIASAMNQGRDPIPSGLGPAGATP